MVTGNYKVSFKGLLNTIEAGGDPGQGELLGRENDAIRQRFFRPSLP
jgi:hypothetical protein